MLARSSLLAAAGVLSGALAACGDDATRQRTSRPAAAQAPAAAAMQLGRRATVSAQANIFGAGRQAPPAPGGGGAGALPPLWRLPHGSDRVVRVSRATGRVNPIVDVSTPNGPAGDGRGPTDVESYGGISGIVHRRNGMFLVGVFLGDDPPAGHGPARLDFTRSKPLGALAPRIGQSFLIGNGRGRAFRVPPRATRLFLGFADGYLYQGEPGWYGNNAGRLTVRVDMTRR